MNKQIQQIGVTTHYVEGEAVDTQVVRLVEAALNMLDNDYQKVRVLNWHIQKINDARSAELEASSAGQMQEATNGPAR